MIGSKVAERLGQSQGRQFRMVAKKSVQFRSINIRNSEAKGLVQSQGRHRDQERQGNLHKHRLYQLPNRQVGNEQRSDSVLWLHWQEIRAVLDFDSSTRR